MVDVKKEYRQFCEINGIFYQEIEASVRSHNDSTLFCPAGMQQFEPYFNDASQAKPAHTVANIRPCIRIKDIDEIGDGSHLLYFNMIGLFSFDNMTVRGAIRFWILFLKKLNLTISHITIHPDKMKEWSEYYREYGIEIKEDADCIWSNGKELKGYCSEFYIDGVEIGNIVNINGNCIDVGFGYERLNQIVNKLPPKNTEEILEDTALAIIDAGYKPGPKQQGYVLRKILTRLVKLGKCIDHPFYIEEEERHKKTQQKYLRLKNKYLDKSKEWWWDTHGIDIKEVTDD